MTIDEQINDNLFQILDLMRFYMTGEITQIITSMLIAIVFSIGLIAGILLLNAFSFWKW